MAHTCPFCRTPFESAWAALNHVCYAVAAGQQEQWTPALACWREGKALEVSVMEVDGTDDSVTDEVCILVIVFACAFAFVCLFCSGRHVA